MASLIAEICKWLLPCRILPTLFCHYLRKALNLVSNEKELQESCSGSTHSNHDKQCISDTQRKPWLIAPNFGPRNEQWTLPCFLTPPFSVLNITAKFLLNVLFSIPYIHWDDNGFCLMLRFVRLVHNLAVRNCRNLFYERSWVCQNLENPGLFLTYFCRTIHMNITP